jgi:hypothetical protein
MATYILAHLISQKHHQVFLVDPSYQLVNKQHMNVTTNLNMLILTIATHVYLRHIRNVMWGKLYLVSLTMNVN